MNKLIIGGREFSSRLFVGTGKFSSNELMEKAIEASGSEMITVAMKRINMTQEATDDMLTRIDRNRVQFLPNTSGVRNAEEAVLAAQFSRECFGTDFVKLEIHPDPKYLLPDPVETLKATEQLAKLGFVVLPYIQADPVLCKRLEEVGAALQLGKAQLPLAHEVVVGILKTVHEVVGALLQTLLILLLQLSGGLRQVILDLLTQLVELVEAVRQLDGAAHGEGDVHQVQAGDERRGRDRIRRADAEQPRHDRRVDDMAQKTRAETEEKRICQADAPVELVFAVGVVPPAHVEEHLHDPAGEILQRGGEHHAGKERQNRIFQPAM